jgi:hypothetical protein
MGDDVKLLLDWLRDIGTAGVVIFVMMVFLKYIRQRDETMEKALNQMTEAFTKLTAFLNGRER